MGDTPDMTGTLLLAVPVEGWQVVAAVPGGELFFVEESTGNCYWNCPEFLLHEMAQQFQAQSEQNSTPEQQPPPQLPPYASPSLPQVPAVEEARQRSYANEWKRSSKSDLQAPAIRIGGKSTEAGSEYAPTDTQHRASSSSQKSFNENRGLHIAQPAPPPVPAYNSAYAANPPTSNYSANYSPSTTAKPEPVRVAAPAVSAAGKFDRAGIQELLSRHAAKENMSCVDMGGGLFRMEKGNKAANLIGGALLQYICVKTRVLFGADGYVYRVEVWNATPAGGVSGGLIGAKMTKDAKNRISSAISSDCMIYGIQFADLPKSPI